MARRIREDIDHWFENHLDIPSRTIYIGPTNDNAEADPEINAHNAAHAIKALMLLDRAYSPEKPITIILNTPGGIVEHGFAIYDAIRACKCEVNVEVIGQACSMGSIILQAADHRRAHPNAIIMVHDGGTTEDGNARDVELAAELSKRLRWRTYRIYSERSGKSDEYWHQKCRNDYFMFAEDALAEGLIDEIIR